jgi:hypothetical protein
MSAGADLGAVFDEHVASEFETKDINATMATMVPEPYVWHVPVLTGASGGEAVRDFYVTHFIGQTPDDAVLHPIARTVSENRVIDEFVLEFTHDAEVPFMLPGVAPLSSWASRARRSRTSTSTGTKRRCSFSWACWIQPGSLWQAASRPIGCWNSRARRARN